MQQKFGERSRIWFTLALCFLGGSVLGAMLVSLYWRYGRDHLALGMLQLFLYESSEIEQQRLFLFLLYRYTKVQCLFYIVGVFPWGYLLSGTFLIISGFLFGYMQTAVFLLEGLRSFLAVFAFTGLQILFPGLVLMLQMERIWKREDRIPGRGNHGTKWWALYAARCIFFSACMIIAAWLESQVICVIVTKFT